MADVVQAALHIQLGLPHNARHRVSRTAALTTLTHWDGADLSHKTIVMAVREFIQVPKRAESDCATSCRARRNPHLLHRGMHTGMRLGSNRDPDEIRALISDG